MADPKGPGTGDEGKAASSARPRSPTLDLSAKDVSSKATAPKDSSKSEPAPAAPKSAPAEQKSATPPGGTIRGEAAKPEPAKPESIKPETFKPAPANAAASGAGPADPVKPAQTAADTPQSAAPKPESPTKPAASPQPSPQSSRAAPPPRPDREGVGPLGLLAAAIGGAALAVLAVALFGRHLIPVPEPDFRRVATVETKLDVVGRDVAALREQLAKTAQTADTSAIDGRLAELSKSIETSNGRVGGVEKELRALADQVAQPPAQDPAVGVLTGRVSGIELRLQQSPTVEAVEVLAGRIAGLEARSNDMPTKDSIAALVAKVDAMGQSVAGVGQAIGAATSPIAQRVDELSAALKDKPEGDAQARLVVALGALDQALGDGRPFAAELAAVKATAGGNAELAALDSYANAGVPTREALGAQLAGEIAKLKPLNAAASDSVFERFVANVGGVVKVTPQSGAAGGDAASARARVAQLGAAGDIEGALAARGKLDEDARAATESWAALATARMLAENALTSARTAALSRLSAND